MNRIIYSLCLSLVLAGNALAGGINAGPYYIASDTYANIVANYPAASNTGSYVWATDINGGAPFVARNSLWRPVNSVMDVWGGNQQYILIGGSGATYSQSGTTVTVTWASHGLTADFNGAQVYLTQSTGSLTSGWFADFTYVDANTFTATSSVSQSTSGNLGTQTGEIYLPTLWTQPTGLFQAGDAVTSALTFSGRNKNSANNKTIRIYQGGIQNASGNTTKTTDTTWWGGSGNRIDWMSTTTYINQGQSSVAAQTPADGTYTASLQLANAADWVLLMPERIATAFHN